MDNPEKLATLGTHDAGRRKTHHSTQTTGGKDKRTFFYAEVVITINI